MSGQPLDDILRNKIDRLHKKRIDEKLPEMYAKTVYQSLLDTEIISSDRAIKIIKQNSPLDNDEIIVKGLNSLLDSKKLVSTNHGGKLYLRKNNLKGIVD
jgi:hypothetical protein